MERFTDIPLDLNAPEPARDSVDEFIEAIGNIWPFDEWEIAPGHSSACPECPECDEGSFSWSACESCGSTLGGNRYPAHALPLPLGMGEPVHIDICVDCLHYWAG